MSQKGSGITVLAEVARATGQTYRLTYCATRTDRYRIEVKTLKGWERTHITIPSALADDLFDAMEHPALKTEAVS